MGDNLRGPFASELLPRALCGAAPPPTELLAAEFLRLAFPPPPSGVNFIPACFRLPVDVFIRDVLLTPPPPPPPPPPPEILSNDIALCEIKRFVLLAVVSFCVVFSLVSVQPKVVESMERRMSSSLRFSEVRPRLSMRGERGRSRGIAILAISCE